MRRRAPYEIEYDVERIKRAAETSISMDEIAIKLDLSKKQVLTSLRNHPKLLRKIQIKLYENLIEFNKTDDLDVCSIPLEELEIPEVDLEPIISEESNAIIPISKEEETVPKLQIEENVDDNLASNHSSNAIAVMDTSICGVPGILSIINLQKKVLVSNLTIKELRKLKASKRGRDSEDASTILLRLAKNHKPYESVFIKKTSTYVDDSIIEYCEQRKDEVVLFTADQEMAALARGKGITVDFFERVPIEFDVIPNGFTINADNMGKIITLDAINYVAGDLTIRLNNIANQKNMAIITQRKQPTAKRKPVFLSVGDEIFIAKLRDNCVILSHFKVCKLSKKDNCEVVFSAKIFNKNGVENLPRDEYKKITRNLVKLIKI